MLRFLLEAAGSDDESKNKVQGSTFSQDNITRALMSSMINNNQFADYQANAQQTQNQQKVDAMKNQREQELELMKKGTS